MEPARERDIETDAAWRVDGGNANNARECLKLLLDNGFQGSLMHPVRRSRRADD